jgi:signal transduction histidine kinase
MPEALRLPARESRALEVRQSPTLLARFLLILTSLFLIVAVPGIGFLVHTELQVDRDSLAARIGNQAARAAGALERHGIRGNSDLARDLVSPLASDLAFVCAELRDEAGGPHFVWPPVVGCQGQQDAVELVLPVGEDDGSTLSVHFSDAELRAAKRLQLTLALSVVLMAFVAAVFSAIIGFRLIVGRPLRLLLDAIRQAARTGERRLVGVKRTDELGTVIDAFDELIERENERELALNRLNAELQESSRRLAAERNRADAASEAKTNFLAMMSNELRTPLNAVIGFSEIIRDEVFGPAGDDRYKEYATDINDSGKHLLSLINDVLDLSKIESGMDELDEESIVVARLVRSAQRLVQPRAAKGEVHLEVEVADELPPLWADARKTKQVLVNLLSNAVKFTDPGGTVTLKAWASPRSGLVLQVTDTGIGMAPEDIPKALSRFGQVESSGDRRYEGTGLGLPLTKVLIEQHGGSLDLQSQLGVGTTATVRFAALRLLEPEVAVESHSVPRVATG